MRRWRAWIKDVARTDQVALLFEVNAYINKIMPYRTDDVVYGRSDYWATPSEFLTNTGDCEDYSIIKYVSLLELGFDENRLAKSSITSHKNTITIKSERAVSTDSCSVWRGSPDNP